MARNSMRGDSHEKEVYYLVNRIKDNMSFLDKQDLKVLRYLSTKGDFPEQKAILISTK